MSDWTSRRSKQAVEPLLQKFSVNVDTDSRELKHCLSSISQMSPSQQLELALRLDYK